MSSPLSFRITLALSLAGFSCFLLLYGTQPLLPQLTVAFGVTPGNASLAVTAGTGAMALLLIPLSLIADRWGRERLMRLGLAGAAVFSLASAWAPDFWLLVLARAGLGICIAGVPAAAMAHLWEELPAAERTRAMGLYIGANALGGMAGRLLAAAVSDWAGNWHDGLLAVSLLGLLVAVAFWRLPAAIRLTEQAGFSANGYRLRFQQLLATPILFAAMSILAAAFSLRLARLGGLAGLADAGVALGFVVFFFNEFSGALADADIIPLYAAAWAPPLVALLSGLALLCYTEDG